MIKAFIILWSTLVGSSVANRLPSNEIIPWLDAPHPTTPESISLGCYVLLPPDTPAPVRIFMETYGNTSLITRVAFQTNNPSNRTCASSIHVDTSFKSKNEYLADYVTHINRYENSTCYIDGNDVPSREIVVQIKPVTNFDLTQWRCVAEMSNGITFISHQAQGNLFRQYRVYQHSMHRKNNSIFYLQVKVNQHGNRSQKKPGSLPLTCEIQDSNSTIFVPNIRDFPVQPWKPFKLKIRSRNKIHSIETDMYDRIAGELQLPSKEIKRSKCISYSQYETSCLNEQYIKTTGDGSTNPLLDSSQCFNFTLIVAPNLIRNNTALSHVTFVRTLFDFGTEFDSKCKFNSQTIILPECLSYPLQPAATIEIKDKVVLELPTESNYHCFRLFNTHIYYTLQTVKYKPETGTIFQNFYTPHISLCPDTKLITDLYKNIIDGMKQYRYMEVRYIQQPPLNHKPRIALDCGKTSSAKLIYISSGSCDQNRTLWCGQKGGEYAVKSEILEDGRVKIIEKKLDVNNQNRHFHIMTCLWRMYFCFTGKRIDDIPPSEVILIENKSVDLAKSVKISKYTGYHIKPDECPYGEQMVTSLDVTNKYHLLEIKNMTINVTQITDESRTYLYSIKFSPTHFFHVQKNVSLALLNDSCPCRTRPTVCSNNVTGRNIFSANIPFNQVITQENDPDVWCEAFDQKSKSYKLSGLAVKYLCSYEASDETVKLGAKLLPEPYLEIHPHDYLKDRVIVSCAGIPKVCLNTTSPVVVAVFWNNADNDIHLKWTWQTNKIINESSEVCINSPESTKCNFVTYNNNNPVSLPVPLSNRQPDVSLSIKTSFLKGFTHMKCNYALGLKESKTHSIHSLLAKSQETCTEKDYKIDIFRLSNNTVACDVKYNQNGGICDIPLVTLVSKTNNSEIQAVTCDPSKLKDTSQCLFLKEQGEVTAVLSLRTSTKLDNLSLSCSYKGINVAQMTIPASNVLSHCMDPPTLFTPIIYVDQRYQSTTLTCSYPQQYVNMCKNTTDVEIDLILETVSIFEERQTFILGSRFEAAMDITCSSLLDTGITCMAFNPPNKTLLRLSVPDSLWHHGKILSDTGAKLEVFCSLRNGNQSSTIEFLNITNIKSHEPVTNTTETLRIRDLETVKVGKTYFIAAVICVFLSLFVIGVFIIKLYSCYKRKRKPKTACKNVVQYSSDLKKLPPANYDYREYESLLEKKLEAITSF